MRISDWSSDVCSSDLLVTPVARVNGGLDWEASSALSVSLKVNYLRSNTTGESGYGYDLQPNGDFFIAINNITKSVTQAFSAGVSTVYKFDDLGLPGSFVTVAANYQHYTTKPAGTIHDTPPGHVGNIFNGHHAT